ncbi:MAG TPA: methionyl-tRNA formyltransferase, partial [Coriobacteriia bacterium]
MRVVFMGTPSFAVPSLRAVAGRHDVSGVFTQPDRPSGRGREARPSPVKTAALELGLSVLQPPTLRQSDVVLALEGLSP